VCPAKPLLRRTQTRLIRGCHTYPLHYFRITRSLPVPNATHREWRLLGFLSCATRDSNGKEELPMSDHYWLTETQFERIRPYFPRSHGRPRVDDRRVISGIIHVIRNGLRWRDAPDVYGSHKTLYNRFVRWSLKGIFDRIFSGLVTGGAEPDTVMIDATHLKAHRTACSLAKKGLFRAVLAERKVA
jgi:putative transposase